MTLKACDKNLVCAIDLAKEMIALARKGEEDREDPSCGVLYGILLDSGFRILNLAQKEKKAHAAREGWETAQKGRPADETSTGY